MNNQQNCSRRFLKSMWIRENYMKFITTNNFKPNGEKYEELARIKVADTPVYAHPVLAGNLIYVKDENTLTMFTIE